MRGSILNNKAQIGMQETILVMFIFFIILMIGMIMFFQFNMKSTNEKIDGYNEFRFKQLIDVVPNLAELRYSKLGIENIWCIDLLKARAFSQISSGDDYGFKRITLNSGSELVLYEKVRRNGEARVVTSPVCVYDPRSDKFSLAELKVEWWS